MLKRPALLGAAGMAIVAALLVTVLATRPSAESRLSKSPLIGKPARALSGEGIDGKPIDLSALRGKWVVVNFFATWCVPCQQEHPELVAFEAAHKASGDAAIVAVMWQDTVSRVRSYFSSKGGGWPVLDDPNGNVALDWGVRGPPESYVIDPNGIVVAKFTGPLTNSALESVLAAGSKA